MRRASPSLSPFGIALVGCAGLMLITLAAGLVMLIWILRAGQSATHVAHVTAEPTRAAIPHASSAPLPILPTLTAAPTATPLPPTLMPTLLPTIPPMLPPTLPPPPPPTPTWIVTRPGPTTPPDPILPDGALVNGPNARGFDLATFIKAQPGLIRAHSETIVGRKLTALEMVEFVSLNTSISPRLLLALLEYRGGWLSNPTPQGDALAYPMGRIDPARAGLFAQLIWAANALNDGYYGYKTRGVIALSLPDGSKRYYAPALNAASLAVQSVLAQTTRDVGVWAFDVAPSGFRATYTRLFGDPFAAGAAPPAPPDLQQPLMLLPFAPGETWRFSGGPHGGWDRRGSAWGAVDFAPPRPPDSILQTQGKCHVSPFFARAVADGVVARAQDGAVALDLDMDGDERTGWVVLYLHIARQDRATAGAMLRAGDPIGRPSCEGFYLNSPGTHIHIARRYNGEWIAADCWACLPGVAAPPFVMSGWRAIGEGRQVSMGRMERLPDAPNVEGIGRVVRLGEPIAWRGEW